MHFLDVKAYYYNLIDEIERVEREIGFILADENVDAENTIDAGIVDEHSVDFWQAMIRSAQSGAGLRAEAAGYNINRLLGRTIY